MPRRSTPRLVIPLSLPLALLAACEKQNAPAPAAPAADPHAGHATGGHAHGSPHGGVVMSAPGGHVEATLGRDGRITVWLLDDQERTVAPQGASARVRLAIAGAPDVVLTVDPAQNALVGRVAVPTADHVVGLVTVTRPGTPPSTTRFTFHLEGGGH